MKEAGFQEDDSIARFKKRVDERTKKAEGVPQSEIDRMQREFDEASKDRRVLSADERKRAADREREANEAEIALTQTEKGNISDATRFSWAWKVGLVTAIGGAIGLIKACSP